MCSGKVSISCSTCGMHRVTLVKAFRDICIASLTILGYMHRPSCVFSCDANEEIVAINLFNQLYQGTESNEVSNNIYGKA